MIARIATFVPMTVLHYLIESGEGHQSLTGFPESRRTPIAHLPALLLSTSLRLFVSVTAGICKLSGISRTFDDSG
jgi:hypothetical protein